MAARGGFASGALRRSVFDPGGGPMGLSFYRRSVEHPHDVRRLLQGARLHRGQAANSFHIRRGEPLGRGCEE